MPRARHTPPLQTLRGILRQPDTHAGWLYLKPGDWTLDTTGFFYGADIDLAPEYEAALRAQLEAAGWVCTVSSEDIEDAIANTCDQLDAPSDAELLRAVRYFYDHDAFMDWDAPHQP